METHLVVILVCLTALWWLLRDYFTAAQHDDFIAPLPDEEPPDPGRELAEMGESDHYRPRG